jgi:sulfite reductase (NADPH) flavoprotein alpha-component
MKLPESAPFTEDQRQNLSNLLAAFNPMQAGWLSGFLAGSFQGAAAAVGQTAPRDQPVPVTVLYGSESGNCEELAAEDFKALRGLGYEPRLLNMADTNVGILQETKNLLVIVSTWGDGDPPDSAARFHTALMAESAPRLKHLRFAVCALGDTSYEKFCQCGKDFDRRLAELGGRRLTERMDCDVDYEGSHAQWFATLVGELDRFRGELATASPAAAALFPSQQPAIAYSKKNPFPAPLLRKFVLNGRGSDKETWHLEFGLGGSGFTHEPGDALGVVPRNAPDTLEALLAAGGFDPNRVVRIKDREIAFGDALAWHLDITHLTSTVAAKFNALAGSEKLARLLEPGHKDELAAYLEGRQIIDLLEDFPLPGLAEQDFATALRKLTPRLYSIASSAKTHPDEVHVTVAAVRYQSHGKTRKGVASTFLADLAKVGGDPVGVFPHHNPNFRLPPAGETPLIMVGPGTGVAPFRAFIEERAATAATGKSWLFFGDQRYAYDFLYQLEWQEHLKTGALTRIDLAFSRDQRDKIYVQHRLLERAAELWAWLEEGAHFYVCGDGSRMAHDVHHALLQAIQRGGGLKPEAAEAYVADLKRARRYQRDVY